MLSATLDILKAIAEGKGPARWVAALGYAGWEGGQLEQEMRRHGWFVTPGDESLLYDATSTRAGPPRFSGAGVDSAAADRGVRHGLSADLSPNRFVAF